MEVPPYWMKFSLSRPPSYFSEHNQEIFPKEGLSVFWNITFKREEAISNV
jgi:hypothetical protein